MSMEKIFVISRSEENSVYIAFSPDEPEYQATSHTSREEAVGLLISTYSEYFNTEITQVDKLEPKKREE